MPIAISFAKHAHTIPFLDGGTWDWYYRHMSKSATKWTEEHVLGLPSEDDAFERKGAMLLDLTLPGVTEDKVLDELAKQLSAFANTGGGQIIYGLDDNGVVDNGGVTQILKGRSTAKDWLESVIPKLTEFEIAGFNVYAIERCGANSKIADGKALYVVDVPDRLHPAISPHVVGRLVNPSQPI